MTTIRELYNDAVILNLDPVLLLLDFLLFEKQAIKFENNIKVLDLYFKENNRARMNKLLIDFKTKNGGN